jgi:AcrR family transcriptional regulator
VYEETKPRLGRPPATNSADTQDRILLVARCAFAELGYGVATNKDVAHRAGITTGALYHYFDSKTAMYWAVFDHVQRTVGRFLADAIKPFSTFTGQAEAFFRGLQQLNGKEPSLAEFLNAARIDITRYTELKIDFQDRYPRVRRHFIPGLVALGVSTGEIEPDRADQVADFLHAFVTGLMDPASMRYEEQERAIEALLSLLQGTLIKAPTTSPMQP